MKEFPSSTCVECGKAWPSGLQSYCEFGGFCTRYIPRALRVALADAYSVNADLLEAAYQALVDVMEIASATGLHAPSESLIRAATAKAKGDAQ